MALAWSPLERGLLLSGATDAQLLLWDVTAGQQRQALVGGGDGGSCGDRQDLLRRVALERGELCLPSLGRPLEGRVVTAVG